MTYESRPETALWPYFFEARSKAANRAWTGTFELYPKSLSDTARGIIYHRLRENTRIQCMDIAFIDCESVKLANGKSLIHDISIVAGHFDTVKCWASFGRGRDPVYINKSEIYRGPGINIVIGHALKHPAVEMSERAQNKLKQSHETATANGFSIVKVPTLKKALHVMIEFIFTHTGGIVMGHSLDRDLQFLSETADILGERNVFSKDFIFRPENGCYIPGWNNLTLVCTQRFLTTLCPKFDKLVRNVLGDTRLETYVRYINGKDHVQSHTSVGDVLDLFTVMAKAYEVDHFKVDIGSSKLFMKPTSLCGRGQTFSSFPHPLKQY
jgi:hypothetical protein